MPDEATKPKKCPDCAEIVQGDAKVCRYCGYRFKGVSESRALAIILCVVIGVAIAWWGWHNTNAKAQADQDAFIECVMAGRSNCK